MLVINSRTAFEIARGIKVFLNLEAGVTRGEVPGSAPKVAAVPEQSNTQTQELGQISNQLAEREQEITRLKSRLELLTSADRSGGLDDKNIVWIFGTGRSGSTWLAAMMGEPSAHRLWNEPLAGKLFGDFYTDTLPMNGARETFIMADANRESWLEGIRFFVLQIARTLYPGLAENHRLIIKEPNGSLGAPLLMEAMPQSRMILLVRDPRDVVSSAFDGHRKGGHAYERTVNLDPRRKEALLKNPPDNRPGSFVKAQAHRYLRNVEAAKRAYEAHEGYKVLVRYEDLRADTLGTMRHIYSALKIPTDEAELARTVDKHAWENIPEEEKGPGKIRRKAPPGGWRGDLTPKQVEIVEQVTAPLLKEFYPVSSNTQDTGRL